MHARLRVRIQESGLRVRRCVYFLMDLVYAISSRLATLWKSVGALVFASVFPCLYETLPLVCVRVFLQGWRRDRSLKVGAAILCEVRMR